MSACKKFKRGKEIAIEDLYQNKNFVPPKEQNLETIFEEPKQAKDGAPILTSVRKYKRYLDFDPITGKVHKRNKKAKRCVKKIKGKTRSASKVLKDIDISAILETLTESSDECEMDLTLTTSKSVDGVHEAKNSVNMLPIENKTVNDNSDQMAKNNLRLLSVENKTECDDSEFKSKINVPSIEDKTVDADTLCTKCELTKQFCRCESALLQESIQSKQTENRNETCSSLNTCVVT